MTYRKFQNQCAAGTQVKSNERTGRILKISQDNEKALVKFRDGMTEWIEYYKLEIV